MIVGAKTNVLVGDIACSTITEAITAKKRNPDAKITLDGKEYTTITKKIASSVAKYQNVEWIICASGASYQIGIGETFTRPSDVVSVAWLRLKTYYILS